LISELRAAMSMARLRRDHRKREQADQHVVAARP
jgi:hypothetical protein